MTFAQQAQKEHKRLSSKKAELESQLKEVDRELKALDAYIGTQPRPTARRKPHRKSLGRISFLTSIAGSKVIKRAEIITALNAKGDAKATRSIDASLNALKKSKKITRNKSGVCPAIVAADHRFIQVLLPHVVK